MGIALLFLLAGTSFAADFPQWRGAARDGVIEARTEWQAKLQQKWKLTVGEGHSTPVLAGGRLFVFARDKGQEHLLALDPATGKVIWRQSYAAPYRINPAATSHGEGPKSTPLVHNGRIYTLGISGILSAWDASSGKLTWRKEFAGRFKETSPLYGTAMSPLADGNVLIAHVGGHDDGALIAFDTGTGAEKWQWKGDGPSYASPVMATFEGVRQIVTQSQDHVIGVDPASGALLWKVEHKTDYSQDIVTPVIHGGLLVYSGIGNNGSGRGVFALKPARKGAVWQAERVWQNTEVALYMSNAVRKGGLLFGVAMQNKGQPFCLDLSNGKTLWKGKPRQGDNASLLLSGDALVMLTTEGDLVIAKAAADAYAELHRHKVAQSATWAYPVPFGTGWVIKDFDSVSLWQ
ncbi:MAG: PQQ-like beta-propeller repeat protein [Bryobacterales bacterium]|nr:PQQ-like beta-propeller repeat protein [Bryobacterales bacterium]